MKDQIMFKASVLAIAFCITAVSCAAAIPSTQITMSPQPLSSKGWFWKEPYQNYAPQGVPDFDQQQNNWQKIIAGPNGIIDSTVSGDDIFNVADNCIAPGPNCMLESVAAGDDLVKWAFCGPVAVANCLWWFDSKFADPSGTPGDGLDIYPMVEDYGAGDDHSANNVPLLIESLAQTMGTCDVGTTTVTMMTDGITDWLQTTGLDIAYDLNAYTTPTFDFIEGEIERSQNVMLLLGFYEYVVGDKVVDQEQPFFTFRNDNLQTITWNDYQSFVPTVSRLDAIQICLVSNGPPCDIEINVYDVQSGTPIGTTIMNPGSLVSPTWVQFHFDPYVSLTPNNTYYFDVRQVLTGFHYEWFYANIIDIPSDPYPPGQGWLDTLGTDPLGYPFDWTFRTEHYYPPPTVERREGHFVTCAGVNSDEFMIAFSDPAKDVANTSSTNHNDAINVSHDIYNITIGTPYPDIETEWWLPDYSTAYDYCIVEHAVVLCFVPDEEAPLVEITRPIKALYFFDQEVIPLPIPVPLVLGPITVEVNAFDNRSGIYHVDFYVDDVLQLNCTSAPYTWKWETFGLFIYNLRVIAYDNAGNYAPQTMAVLKIL
ncbi:MAG: hypothetical protein KKC68_01045 [Candidatus Thermoplasmatota archaeon]|nr:hypothetical protein [Candidatus Thermoplasmatota archaeon]MBU1940336.1 hypothetical protein [Candidatus Thermoplasmatota archaeon]